MEGDMAVLHQLAWLPMARSLLLEGQGSKEHLPYDQLDLQALRFPLLSLCSVTMVSAGTHSMSKSISYTCPDKERRLLPLDVI